MPDNFTKNSNTTYSNSQSDFDKAMNEVERLFSTEQKFANNLHAIALNGNLRETQSSTNIQKNKKQHQNKNEEDNHTQESKVELTQELGAVHTKIESHLQTLQQLKKEIPIKQNHVTKELLHQATNEFLSQQEINNIKKDAAISSILSAIVQKVENRTSQITRNFDDYAKQNEKQLEVEHKTQKIDVTRQTLGPNTVGGNIVGKLISNIMQGVGEIIQNIQQSSIISPSQQSKNEIQQSTLKTRLSNGMKELQHINEIISMKQELIQIKPGEKQIIPGSLTPPHTPPYHTKQRSI